MFLGLSYLKLQTETTNLFTEQIADQVADGNNNVYQQSSDVNRSIVSEEELYAMIMGYRDYPIIIDGKEISTEGDDVETYIAYLADGLYLKKYRYNSNHEIEKIIVTYTGT